MSEYETLTHYADKIEIEGKRSQQRNRCIAENYTYEKIDHEIILFC